MVSERKDNGCYVGVTHSRFGWPSTSSGAGVACGGVSMLGVDGVAAGTCDACANIEAAERQKSALSLIVLFGLWEQRRQMPLSVSCEE